MKKQWIDLLVVLTIFSLLVVSGDGFEQTKNGQKISIQSHPAKINRFKTFIYIDRQGIGIEAFRLLIPSDWKFEGGIRWLLDNPGMPAVVSFRIRNPEGTEELEVFPNQPFFWTDNQMLLYSFPIGSRYFGSEVHPPVGVLEALKTIVLPRFRGDVYNLRIVNEQILPELAKSLAQVTPAQPGVCTSVEGAKIRIEYQKDNKWFEEEMYGVVETVSFSMQMLTGSVTNTNWMVDYLFSFKAEKGKLEPASELFQTMISSFRINPQWFNKYNQVVQFLVQHQIQQIQHIGQLSRIISQTNNEINDMIMDSYNQRQAVYDRISENFSQYIRGVDEYYNPLEQQSVELPTGYDNVWANSNGEYILSDDPNFDPNIGSNLTWHKLERRR
ncbi:hypothetical protein J7M23_08415 [Candidatus Sumerlaeota bacterium]|nr:hypothetical protein [Candidatus Sumerlaeota bacterium]